MYNIQREGERERERVTIWRKLGNGKWESGLSLTLER
jgi:hypothetical protein